jgi:cytochrome P450
MATEQLVGDLAAEARLDDPDFYQDPDRFRVYARLRREAPVYWHEPGGFWALSRHEDISSLLLLGCPPITTTQGLFMFEAQRPDLVDARDVGGAQQASGTFMSDPPQHTRFRRLMSGAFDESGLAALRNIAQGLSDELLDELPADEPVNFVEAFSAPYAAGVIAAFLGLSRANWGNIMRWTESFNGPSGGNIDEGTPEWEQSQKDLADMGAFFAEELAERAREPRGDLLSTLATIEIDGEPLPTESRVAVAFGVMIAGNDTTRHALSGGIAAFAEHPDQWDKLCDDPKLIPRAIEEMLRWVTPVIHFGRRAMEPLVIRDQQIAEGDFVVVLYESADKDEEAWPDADTFDIARVARPPHLAFGWGIHRCVGATLAQMEMRIALDGMIKRFRGWKLAGPPVRTRSTLVNNYIDVPVVLTRR